MEPNHIYQYSLLNALMAGISTSGIQPSTLLKKGNQGLGTFARMDGELILLGSKIYQLQSGGRVREAPAEAIIPFAVATQFAPQHTVEVALGSKAALEDVLREWAPNAGNLYVSYRITGRFGKVKCRTVQGQEYEGQPLSELGKKQSVEEYGGEGDGVEGTIIGFRTPANWQGFGVAGEHMHFLRKDCRAGGHVLEVESEGLVKVEVAVASHVHVELPTGEDFNKAELVTDDAGVREVEG